jgi:hypothetical protein
VSPQDARETLGEYPGTILFSNIFAGIFVVILIALAWRLGASDNSSPLNFLICLLGATLGWAVGILLTPYTAGEQQQFASLLQAATAFATGYLFSKFDPLLERYLKQDQLPGVAVMQRAALFVVAFLLSTTLVFVNRQYYGGALVQDLVHKVTARLEKHGSSPEVPSH